MDNAQTWTEKLAVWLLGRYYKSKGFSWTFTWFFGGPKKKDNK